MAFPTPVVTIIDYSGDATEDGFAEALYAHWASGGASTKFTASDPYDTTAGGTGSFSFTLDPDDVGETWQANFRRGGTPAADAGDNFGYFTIDPGAGITNSSTLANATSDASSDIKCTYIADASYTVALLEWDDAFMILQESADGSYYPYGCHVGRIFSGILQSNIDNGLDGLGVLGYIPMWGNAAGANHWLANTGANTSEMHTGTDEWSAAPYQAWDFTVSVATEVGDRREPVPIVWSRVSAYCPLGVMKYIYKWSPEDTPKTRLADGSLDPKYMYTTNSYVVTDQIVPWDLTTIP